jgi:hypothetical protein
MSKRRHGSLGHNPGGCFCRNKRDKLALGLLPGLRDTVSRTHEINLAHVRRQPQASVSDAGGRQV